MPSRRKGHHHHQKKANATEPQKVAENDADEEGEDKEKPTSGEKPTEEEEVEDPETKEASVTTSPEPDDESTIIHETEQEEEEVEIEEVDETPDDQQPLVSEVKLEIKHGKVEIPIPEKGESKTDDDESEESIIQELLTHQILTPVIRVVAPEEEPSKEKPRESVYDNLDPGPDEKPEESLQKPDHNVGLDAEAGEKEGDTGTIRIAKIRLASPQKNGDKVELLVSEEDEEHVEKGPPRWTAIDWALTNAITVVVIFTLFGYWLFFRDPPVVADKN